MDPEIASVSITQFRQEVSDGQIKTAITTWKLTNSDNRLVDYTVSESVYSVGGKTQYRIRIFFKYHKIENSQPQA